MNGTISLVVCTLGRFEPLERLLGSLERQTNRKFEVIVVDQNPDGFLDAALSRHPGLPIVHMRSPKGLSRARNVGLTRCSGAIIGFPDDDCWYDPDVLKKVETLFAARPDMAFMSGRTVDAEGAVSLNRYPDESAPIDRSNIFAATNSNAIFVRSDVARDVRGFDETLGVGAATPFQAGEETDFLLRCLACGHKGLYEPGLVVRHDQVTDSLQRLRAYSAGFGRVARIHGLGTSVFFPRNVRTIAGGFYRALKGDVAGARQRYACLMGSIRGYAAPLADSASGRDAGR